MMNNKFIEYDSDAKIYTNFNLTSEEKNVLSNILKFSKKIYYNKNEKIIMIKKYDIKYRIIIQNCENNNTYTIIFKSNESLSN